MTCYVVIRSKSGKRRVCGKPAGPDGVCEKHQHVHDLIHRINREAMDADKLTQAAKDED